MGRGVGGGRSSGLLPLVAANEPAVITSLVEQVTFPGSWCVALKWRDRNMTGDAPAFPLAQVWVTALDGGLVQPGRAAVVWPVWRSTGAAPFTFDRLARVCPAEIEIGTHAFCAWCESLHCDHAIAAQLLAGPLPPPPAGPRPRPPQPPLFAGPARLPFGDIIEVIDAGPSASSETVFTCVRVGELAYVHAHPGNVDRNWSLPLGHPSCPACGRERCWLYARVSDTIARTEDLREWLAEHIAGAEVFEGTDGSNARNPSAHITADGAHVRLSRAGKPGARVWSLSVARDVRPRRADGLPLRSEAWPRRGKCTFCPPYPCVHDALDRRYRSGPVIR